ncbi:hypothetical protein HRR83_009389 [Exophiala dermatitidis]|uniref:Adenylate cyclase n=2 Tax=Exophiala dermatitidis TaxID=5970 RepID=H6BLZ1_EXODN|nr:uncharacterized protein HMPREF1120_01129 [Exophiala dermatitidis NIH/UT8656]KAJ4502892.1 hypothetical protein HRR73_009321 [Exophiala dermatitidis]EHY52927.1 hypothetical protein HMPREF1120_01129 [Exophiala dermatitidis NIH/UT8656]KAJ4515172.1 hypothetical protein HRR74_005637 [Exophiala dermatitidis]KAJ4548576.1 hypothetical protein HRR76_001167 [Exophiala dermatitidis]KAJ4552703.1 hypothetical protein HRR77_002703 [Exophiala dermatitidis]
MDHEQGSRIPHGARGSIPRLSRLPMPRAIASSDNLRLTVRTQAVPGARQHELRNISHLPRPSGVSDPLGETFNRSIRSRYGWSDNNGTQRHVSPVREALRETQSTSLERTPPKPLIEPPIHDNGDENPSRKDEGMQLHKEKRRPRPSLSERTMETLAQVSPCPSPQRRTSLSVHDGKMPPPLRPASTLKESRPSSPAASRPISPTRKPFRPPGRISPTKDKSALPPVISPDEIYTPPRAFVRGQHTMTEKPLRPPRRSISSVFEAQSQDTVENPPIKVSAQTVKVRPHPGSKTLNSQNPLSSIFRDPSTDTLGHTKAKAPIDNDRGRLLKSRSTGKTVAPSASSSARSKTLKPTTDRQPAQSVSAVPSPEATSSPKSSAALRQAVASAKAARRKAATGGLSNPVPVSETPVFMSPWSMDGLIMAGDNKTLLRTRIQQAATTGKLDIVGMNLKRLPAEVKDMYNAENSTINWSEMVDLVRLVAADNEIEELEDHFFPDYTAAELEDDDEKSNQFGGLETIDLHRNKLQQLPIGIRRLERLQTLNLNSNRFTNDVIDIVSQIPGLRELRLGENVLNGALNLRAGRFEHLQVLDLHSNRIERIDEEGLARLKNLKVLDISHNKLTTLPWDILSTLPLTELNGSKNQLSGTLFGGQTSLHALRRLDVSYNRLDGVSDVELDLPELRSLVLDGNKITRLPDLTKCKELQILRAAENQLEDIPPSLVHLQTLKSGDFSHNNIRLVDTGIARLANLSSLNLAANPLRERKYLTMTTMELKNDLERKLASDQTDSEALRPQNGVSGTHRYQPAGGILDLSSQSLTVVQLQEVDLSHTDVPIHTLKLSNNDLSEFPVTLLSHPALKYSLRSLDLSHNPLQSINYLGCELFLPNLKSLFIVSTGLTSLDALTTHLKAPCLTELNISCHRLTGKVPWVRAWWPSCHTLLATDNWFTSVEVEGVRGLEVLDIRNNEIDSLPPKLGLLGNLPGTTNSGGKLRVLEVSGNKFRVPRQSVIEKGSEAILRDLRRMIPEQEVPDEWKDAV